MSHKNVCIANHLNQSEKSCKIKIPVIQCSIIISHLLKMVHCFILVYVNISNINTKTFPKYSGVERIKNIQNVEG